MVKILYIICDKNFGGGSRHVFDLITNLDKKKFKPVLITVPSPLEYLFKNKISLHQVDMKSRLDFKAIREIKNITKKEKPDIIHLHSTRAGIIGTLAVKDLDIPIIYTEHLFTDDYIPENKLIHRLQLEALKRLSKNIDRVIAVSKAVKDYLANKKIFSDDKIEVIYNGIKINQYAKPENKKFDKLIIGSIGALSEIKGYKYLIEALKIVNSLEIGNCPPWLVETGKLEIIGEGPDKADLKGLIERYHLQNKIDLIPFSSNIEDKIKKWDIYVQPSLSESFGLATAEAMSIGLPIIATNAGGLKELVDKNSGFLVKPADAKALASAIIKLIQSPAQRAEMGKNARERIKKYFSLDKMIINTQKLYISLLKKIKI